MASVEACQRATMGKLNYSKWDNLELSDDSDIEVHPNVDKNSFIKWKQRDIHEKREMRKIERSQLEAEERTNTDLTPELARLASSTRSEGASFYQRELARLVAGRAERGNKDGPDGPTLDDMLLSLLLQINQEDKVKEKANSPELGDVLVATLESHMKRLAERQETVHAKLKEMDEEDKRKITSDSLHDGWDSGVRTLTDPACGEAQGTCAKAAGEKDDAAYRDAEPPRVPLECPPQERQRLGRRG